MQADLQRHLSAKFRLVAIAITAGAILWVALFGFLKWRSSEAHESHAWPHGEHMRGSTSILVKCTLSNVSTIVENDDWQILMRILKDNLLVILNTIV